MEVTAASHTASASLPISVVILTKDEEANIADCMRSCQWCDDVHVLDSGSSDRTCDIARQMGATVHANSFVSFGRQRNWAIDNIPCRHPWQFHLDADERFTPELVAEMRRELGADGRGAANVAYWVPSRMVFMGKWIRHSSGYPTYQVRLFKRGECRFIDFGHGQREACEGPIGKLAGGYIHYNFSKGLKDWLDKHNRYSSQEAEEAIAVRRQGRPRLRELFSRDRLAARRALKRLSYFLPGRGPAHFFQLYFLRRGFQDGNAGFHYCAMIGMYDFWTELKIRERERPAAGSLTHQDLSAMLADQIRRADALSDQWLRVPPRVQPRPWWRFIDFYVLRLGFLKGSAGWRQARMSANEAYMARLIHRDKLIRAGEQPPHQPDSEGIAARHAGSNPVL